MQQDKLVYNQFDLKMVDTWNNLPENWWRHRVESVHDYKIRLDEFKKWLMQRKESKIIVMCHSGVFGTLLNKQHVNNAGITTVHWHC